MARKDISDLQVCAAYALAFHSGQKIKWPYVLLEEATGQPYKVCNAAMVRAQRRGYIDYGTSLRSGWLTDKGWELLSNYEP